VKTLVTCWALTVALAGCKGSQSTPPEATTNQAPPPTAAVPSKSETPSAAIPTDSKPAADNSSNAAPGPTLDQLPASVKTDAFEYEGLANDKPQKFVDTSVQGSGKTKPEPMTGTFQITLKDIKDGKAIFEEVSTGGQDGGQTEKMSADATGVYHEDLSPVKLLTPHVIELPAKLGPGTTWSDKTSVDLGAGVGISKVVTLDDSNKVVGVKSITTKLGTFDALEVDTSGKGTFDKQAITVDLKRWYVKGVGIVKQVETMKLPTTTTVVTREFTK